MSDERLKQEQTALGCAELDVLLCDYVDGTLAAPVRADVERHLGACPTCAELARDSATAVAYIDRAAEVEVPPALVSRILQQTQVREPVITKARKGLSGLLQRWLEPVLQPRLVMGMAMTILSFAMLGRFAGIEARQLRASDLEPAKVWMAMEDQAHRSWNRAVKYYESLRLVYEIQSRLREWKDEDDAEAQSRPGGTSLNQQQTNQQQNNKNVGDPRR